MASIVKEPRGRRRIDVVVKNERRKIRLGKVSEKHAREILVRVEQLAAAVNRSTSLDDKTGEWLETIDDETHGRLERAGLVKPRQTSARTLKAFLDDVLPTFHVKQSTTTSYGHAKRNLIEHFGADEPIAAINAERADKFRTWLKDDQKLSPATVSSRIRRCRQFFKRAVKWSLVKANPFADVKAGGETNPKRLFFVSQDVAQKLIEACPDAEWRLIVALSRYAGLRCPSEHLALTWEDVDFAAGTLTIRSSKKEADDAGGVRVLPIFGLLRPHLEEAYELADPGAVHVITRRRNPTMNLRTQLLRIIGRAKLTPWPRLFQNLRSSRQTELVETFPIQTVCAWIGNSPEVARKHYLKVLPEHFEQARAEAAHQAAQSPAISGDQQGSAGTEKMDSDAKTADSDRQRGESMGHTGREHPGESRGKPGGRGTRGALNGAVDPRALLIEPQSQAEMIRRMRAAARMVEAAGLIIEEREATAGRGSR